MNSWVAPSKVIAASAAIVSTVYVYMNSQSSLEMSGKVKTLALSVIVYICMAKLSNGITSHGSMQPFFDFLHFFVFFDFFDVLNVNVFFVFLVHFLFECLVFFVLFV